MTTENIADREERLRKLRRMISTNAVLTYAFYAHGRAVMSFQDIELAEQIEADLLLCGASDNANAEPVREAMNLGTVQSVPLTPATEAKMQSLLDAMARIEARQRGIDLPLQPMETSRED